MNARSSKSFSQSGALALGLGLSLAVGAVYLCSLDPDVGFWDTGEMQTVPYILGLAHPTGYPTEILLGWLFTHAVVLGTPAFRMTLLCALSAVASALCCYLLAVLLRADKFTAAACALCFAFTPAVWAHATRTDVIDPTVALCAVALFASLRGALERRRGLVVLAGAASGLALGTHGVAVWFLPACVLLIALFGDRALRAMLLPAFATCALAGAAVYAYLPLRSRAVTNARLDPTLTLGLGPGLPIWDWGHPANLKGFLAVITGSAVGAPHSFDAVLHVGRYAAYAGVLGAQLRAQYPLLIVALLAIAVTAAVARVPKRAALLTPLFLVTPFAAAFAAESDPERYFIFPLLCLWVLAAAGFSQVSADRRAGARNRLATSVVLAAVAAFEIVQSRGLFEQRKDQVGTTYIAHVLQFTPSSAVIVAPWVYVTPLAYAAYVAHATQARIIVPGTISDYEMQAATWAKGRRVFFIAEALPRLAEPTALVHRFNINHAAGHDPKLYEFGPAVGRTLAAPAVGTQEGNSPLRF